MALMKFETDIHHCLKLSRISVNVCALKPGVSNHWNKDGSRQLIVNERMETNDIVSFCQMYVNIVYYDTIINSMSNDLVLSIKEDIERLDLRVVFGGISSR